MNTNDQKTAPEESKLSALTKIEPDAIDRDDPWASDKLERKPIADYLTPVIASVTQPFVISLHSPYGTGKTFFIKRWQRDLQSHGFTVVYFNAWETDFSQDALMAFIASLKEQLEGAENKTVAQAAKKKFPELAKKVGGLVRHKIMPILVRGVARKVLGSDTVDEFVGLSEASEEEITDALGLLAEEGLKAQEAAQKSLQSFKDYLRTIVEELTADESDPHKKKIIIFIDELDRCRPTYAVQVLECIKHFFSVKGLVFVLSVDDAQLRNAIASVYGPNLDADGYLRRFIDWSFSFPVPSARLFGRFLCDKFKLEETGKFKPKHDYFDINKLASGFGLFSEGFNLSLRQQEQCFIQINLVIRSLNENEIPFSKALGCLSVLRFARREKYDSCCDGSEEIENFLVEIDSEMSNVRLDQFSSDWNDLREDIHSWFVNESKVEELHEEITETKNLYATGKKTGVATSDLLELERKFEYLGNVTGNYHDFKKYYGVRRVSIAGIIRKKLDGSEEFLKH